MGRPAAVAGRLPIVFSIGAHAAGFLVLVLVLHLGPPVLPVSERPAPVAESVEYIDLAWPAGVPGDGAGLLESSEMPPVPAGANATLPRQQVGTAPLTFPNAAPAGLPPASGSTGLGNPTAPGAAQGGAGATGSGGRLRPGFRDPRLYVGPAVIPPDRAQPSNHQRYMESLTRRIEASNDSAGIAAREPDTDWTVRDGNGDRWGLSEDGLHLGPLTIPKELVPRPGATGSNAKQEEAREEERRRQEIRAQEEARARRAEQERAIRAARERAAREREEAKQ